MARSGIRFIYKKADKFMHKIKTEIIAGLSTFGAMAYVIVINPLILSEAGLDFGAVMIATILVSAFGSLFMGLYAKLPMAIAPGMGVSASLTFSLVLKYGLTWQEGLTACFASALVLLILNLFRIREKILLTIPTPLLKGATAGIGLFLFTVALKEIGLLKLGASKFVYITPTISHEVLITFIGAILIPILLKKGIKSAFILVMFMNYLLALFLHKTSWNGFVAFPPSLAPTLFKMSFYHLISPTFYQAFFSIFLVTLFDSTAGIMTLGRILYKDKPLPRIQRALMPDCIGSLLGGLIGSTSLAIHIESAAGIKAGGKTGLTSVVVAICFLFCIFFHPLAAAIPSFASAPVLIVLGCMMFMEARTLDWKDYSNFIPALITMITMPLTFSIYFGFAAGFISFVLLKIIAKRQKEIPPVCWIMSLLFALQIAIFR